jgi:hypothetical protein
LRALAIGGIVLVIASVVLSRTNPPRKPAPPLIVTGPIESIDAVSDHVADGNQAWHNRWTDNRLNELDVRMKAIETELKVKGVTDPTK